MEKSDPSGQSRAVPRVSSAEERALEALERGEHRNVLTILMDAYGNEIYGYCRQALGDPELAEDVRQITFVQAYQALDRFTRRSTLRAWLYGIARHRCLDAVKRRRRWRRRFELVDSPAEIPDATLPADPPGDREATAQALGACLDKLSPGVRMAVLLRYQDGLSYPEMAELMGEKASTLQARVARALPGLRRCVKNKGITL